MERMDESNIDPVVYFIHEHRYRWASNFAQGIVLDVACGIGYGSGILRAGGKVKKYLGIDFSDEALGCARRKFTGPGVSFFRGDAQCLALPTTSVDTIVSLETIEHLPEPKKALSEFSRVLKPGGVLIGSVPTVEYEEISEEVHGTNPFHLHRFTFQELEELLGGFFPRVEFFTSEIDVVTTFKALPFAEKERGAMCVDRPHGKGIWGSYFFVARKAGAAEYPPSPAEDCIYYGISAIEYEKFRFRPFREALAAKDSLIDEKERQIRDYAGYVAELKSLFFKPHKLAGKVIKKVLGK